MTEDDHLLLNDLKANMRQLYENYNSLKNEKQVLEEQLSNQEKNIEILKQEKEDLGRKYEKLEIANRLLSGNDENGEAKQKINFLVREIDKCIALLNK